MSTMTDVVVPVEGVQLRGLRSGEFIELLNLGVFGEESVELLGGEVIRRYEPRPEHDWAIEELNSQLAPLLIQGYAVRVQLLLIADENSVPLPDVAVMPRNRPGQVPETARAAIEASWSSLRYDLRLKAPRYAWAGIPLYIVIDLKGQRAMVHREPSPDGYQSIEELGPDAALEILGTPLDLRRLLAPS